MQHAYSALSFILTFPALLSLVQVAWVFSTGLGILLFLCEIAILCWVKFYKISKPTAIASTIIVIPAGIVFVVFSLMFYQKLMAHKSQRHSQGLKELDEMARELQSPVDSDRNLI